jgi:transketolase
MVNTVESTAVNTIRTLAADVVHGANSGHPGKLIDFDHY